MHEGFLVYANYLQIFIWNEQINTNPNIHELEEIGLSEDGSMRYVDKYLQVFELQTVRH